MRVLGIVKRVGVYNRCISQVVRVPKKSYAAVVANKQEQKYMSQYLFYSFFHRSQIQDKNSFICL